MIRCGQGEQRVLLMPLKGTQGRDMNRIVRIASTLALVGSVFVFAPTVASAGSPLLSGYGGPGGGEQAILGSTLLGGSGSGGSSASGGSGGAGQGGSGGISSAGPGTNLAPAHESTRGSSSAGAGTGGTATGRARSRSGGGPRSTTAGGLRAGRKADAAPTRAYVYPSSLRQASASSSVLEISGGDLLVIVGTIATLGLLAVLTIRIGRLQH